MDGGDNEDYWNTSASKAFSFDDTEEHSAESFGKYRLVSDDNVSEVSFELPSNDVPLHTLISDQDLKRILEEQLLEENHFRKGMTKEEELKLLRRKVQDTVHPPLAEVTINKMLLGKKCSLESYKSLSDKIELLDEAIRSGNGDAILGVVLFLVKTLNRKQLNRILLARNDACNHYINYLIVRLEISEAADLLTMLGRDQEAAMLQYKVAVKIHSDPQIKKQRLKKVFSDYFTQPNIVPLYSQIAASAINLLEWQQLENTSSNASHIVNSSALETLYYVCSKHKWKDASSTDHKSPQVFINDHQISLPHFEWVALNERAKAQAYLDLDGLFEKASWLSMKQKQFHMNIPLEAAIIRLHQLKAPPAVLNSFLSKVQDPSKKLALAKEVKATRSIIDALSALKEKQELEQYRDSLPDGTEERFYADNSLKTLSKKWSTEGIKIMKS